MDFLEFITAMTTALAWPVLVLVLVLVLRKPLSELIPLLERLKYKDLELDFTRRVREVASDAEAILAPAVPRPVDEDLEELAAIYPRGAVIESWLRLEKAAAEAARTTGLDLTTRDLRSPSKLVGALERAHIIDKRKAAVLHELRNIRNAAAHASDIALSPSTAREYVETASRLASALLPSSEHES